jgi:hypothetical protein
VRLTGISLHQRTVGPPCWQPLRRVPIRTLILSWAAQGVPGRWCTAVGHRLESRRPTMHGWRQLDRSARDTDPARNVNDHGWGDRGDGQGRPGCRSACGTASKWLPSGAVRQTQKTAPCRRTPTARSTPMGVATGVQSAGTARGPDAPAFQSLAADPTEHCGLLLP